MKISSSQMTRWSAIIAVLYFCFYPHICVTVGGIMCYPILFVCIALSFMSLLLYRMGKFDYLCLAWLGILLISTVTNQGMARKNYLWPVTFIMLILLLLALKENVNWHKTVINLLLLLSLLYCVSTIVLYFIPELYKGAYSFWGYYPNGTERGEFGYRAGLADNHSANGAYCVVSFLITVAALISGDVQDKKEKRKYLIALIVSIIAVLLTTKRAHLLFGCVSAMLCYYLCGKKGKTSRLFKICLIAAVLVTMFYFASSFIPAISDFLEGFEGQEDISNGRYEFWEIAMSYFAKNPIFGIGWLGFRYATLGVYSTVGYVDAHNVYIQLLTESGLVGAAIMLVIFVGTLVQTIKMINGYTDDMGSNIKRILCISLIFQIFCLIYGFTGNFLYDRTCFIYIFGCALSYSVKKYIYYKYPNGEDVSYGKLHNSGL